MAINQVETIIPLQIDSALRDNVGNCSNFCYNHLEEKAAEGQRDQHTNKGGKINVC